MRPLAEADRHDLPWHVDEFVPGVTAMIDNVVVGLKDTVGKPVLSHVLPDVFHRVQLGAARR